MKRLFIVMIISAFALPSFSQSDTSGYIAKERKGGLKKENLFTGGGITLSFSNYGTVLGASPVFGYSVNKWLDAGLVFNYIYATQRHYVYYSNDDKLKQTTIGPGAFVRIFPVNFLFAHAQFERNFMKTRLVPDDSNNPEITQKANSNSFLVGGGYCSGREGTGDVFYYVSILFDVAKDKNSPYVEITESGKVNVLPIIRAGIQIPLFQGKPLF